MAEVCLHLVQTKYKHRLSLPQLTLTTMNDSLLTTKSTTLVSTDSATATNISFSQALADTSNEEVSEKKNIRQKQVLRVIIAFDIRSGTAWRHTVVKRID